jgi:hypothetical protein
MTYIRKRDALRAAKRVSEIMRTGGGFGIKFVDDVERLALFIIQRHNLDLSAKRWATKQKKRQGR